MLKKIIKGTAITSAIILATAGVYALNPDTSIRGYISNFSSSDSEIGKLITSFFDGQGYIKTEFIQPDSIGENQIANNFVAKDSTKLGGELAVNYQKRVTGFCTGSGVIQKIAQDGTVTCFETGTGGGGAVADNLGDHIATENIQLNGNYLSNNGSNKGIRVDNNGNTIVTGNFSSSEGGTSGKNTFAFGIGSSATTSVFPFGGSVSGGAVAMGYNALATGQYSTTGIALGSNVSATGNRGSVAIGQDSTASGQNSMALGQGNSANGTAGTSIGQNSESRGNSSIAIGSNSKALGVSSISMGSYVTSSADNGIIIGKYGQTASDDILSVAYGNNGDQNTIGAGLVFQVKQNGNVKAKGKITSAQTVSGDSSDTVVTKGYVDLNGGGKFVDGSNSTQAVYTGGNVGISTTNPGTKLHIDSTADVQGNSSANGVLMVGPSASTHISMDNNEIMAKNGNGTATLNLNLQGGDTTLGGNIRIKGRTAIFGSQTIYGDNSSAFYVDSNHSTVTNITLRDKENTRYGMIYGDSNGANFGLLDGDGNWSYLAAKDNYTSFRINNSEKMRIKSNGRIGIGTSSPSQQLHTTGVARFDGGIQVDGHTVIDNGAGWHRSYGNSGWYNGTYGGGIYMVDSTWVRTYGGKKFYVNNTIMANSFIYSSDKRLKKDIKTLDNSLEKINKLRGVNFKWKKDNKKDIGLIAQEIEKIYPDLVEEGGNGMKAVKYGNIVAILIEGVKELYNKVVGNSEEIEKLKVENVELKNRLELLEKKINKLVK